MKTDFLFMDSSSSSSSSLFHRGCFSRSTVLQEDEISALSAADGFIIRFNVMRNFLGFTSFNIRDLLRPKEPQVSLNLRTMDGVDEVGEVMVSRLQIEEETPPDHKCLALCDSLHTSIHDKENSPMMRAVLCSQVCKVYRFQTEDRRWLLPYKQVQEVMELGDLSPHLDRLRYDVICHCNHLIGCYQETLADLDNISASSSFKSSCSKSDRQLQFVPTNLHAQDGGGVWYEVITFGAPADHHQGFKHGGLKKLLSKHTHLRDSVASYSQEESSRARELLANVAQLQPLIFGLAEELLSVSLEQNNARLQPVLHSLTQQTKQFVHALKDELVKSALIASHDHSNLCENSTANQEGALTPGQQDAWQQEADYDEEEWDRAWANVGMSLNCIIAMGDRLLGKEEVTSSENQESDHSQNTASWQEQLLPLVVTLRDCVREAELKARVAMTFVMMQAAAAMTVSEGTTNIAQRRHAAFSQALSALVCGFVLRLFSALQDQDFLQQLISAGLLCLPPLRVSLVVEVPLPPETFRSLPQEVRDGRLIRVHPVLFNIGINQQQSLAERFGDSSLQQRVNQQSCERLRAYRNTLRDTLPVTAGVQSLSDLLSSLERCVETRKRKNVEVLWIAAAVQGVLGADAGLCPPLRPRLSGCTAPKPPEGHCYPVAFLLVVPLTCLVLWLIFQPRAHAQQIPVEPPPPRVTCITTSRPPPPRVTCINHQAGCRMENVQKNIGSRKFAFSGVQLLTFPKLYRPPEGSFG
ncbi:hypothetical protein KUCAC02_032993 [Chaenocephalus aceratus]|nr:hypothetical protein KUCAC02_032993 [Chaenocephalus aceratus]